MSFRDDLLEVLSGGLPALIDGPDPAGNTTPATPPRVEETPPSAGIRDREPFLLGVSQNTILLTTAGIIGAIALIMVVRR